MSGSLGHSLDHLWIFASILDDPSAHCVTSIASKAGIPRDATTRVSGLTINRQDAHSFQSLDNHTRTIVTLRDVDVVTLENGQLLAEG